MRVGLSILNSAWPIVLLIAVGILLAHFAPVVGAKARLASLEEKRAALEENRDVWKRSAEGWEASYDLSEHNRQAEAIIAREAAASLIEQCGARVAEARASARVVERIVTKEPSYDEDRCPVRSVVDPDLLRDALTPASGAH